MNYRKLGNTGMEVSEIGYGTWGLGGDSYGPVDDNTSVAALKRAYDLGVTFYDTADVYGEGHSEEIIGDALKHVRDKIIIATKVGTLPHTGFYMPQDFSAKHIREGIEASLRRLKTDYVDLYQLHSPTLDDLAQTPDIIPTLKSLQDEGKIRAYGISAKSPADALEAVSKYGFEVVQVNLNLIDQRAIDSGLFDEIKRLGVGVIARTPLCFGYLTGTLTGDEKFAVRDHRSNWPETQLKCWANAPGLFAHLNDGKSRSITQLALQFCLHSEVVSTVIPGMMSISEVDENVATLNAESFTNQDFEEIRKIYKQNTFYDKSIKETILNATRS